MGTESHELSTFLFLAGAILTVYGAWCLIFTASAVEFCRNWLVGDRANWIITKIHGTLAIIVGMFLCALGLLRTT